MNKEKIINILEWFICGCMGILSLSAFAVSSTAGGILFLLTGLFISPLRKKIISNFKISNLKPSYVIIVSIMLFFISCAVMSQTADFKAIEDTTSEQEVSTENEIYNEKVESEEVLAEMSVHFIDVGQGACTLITCDGHAMLIDAGDNNKGTTVQLYLKTQGIDTLDYVIGTHPDADHLGGLDVILYKFDCETIIMPDIESDTQTYDDVIQTMNSKNYANTLPIVGTTYQLGDATFTIIAPNNYDYGEETNNYSIGIILIHGEKKFLFTGDAENDAEADIVANKIDISADVYQVGHHGSKSATSTDLLSAVNPTYAVISCAEGNSYGHPHSATLNNLRTMGVKVFRTDEQGSIIATSDGKQIIWNCAPSVTWQAGEATVSSTEKAEVKEKSSEVISKEAVTSIAETSDADIPVVVTPEPEVQVIEILDTNSLEVHITETGKKYHSAGCRYLKESDIVTTLGNAKTLGLGPCSVCNPPQ